MRFWFTPSTEVPLREQIVQQVRLGILCGELRGGERLPSTRLLARRYGMHANTVSAAFHQLREEGWVELRHGSGVYVSDRSARRDRPAAGSAGVTSLDALFLQAAALARSLGMEPQTLHAQLDAALQQARIPLRRVLVEPDRELARIVQHEIAKGTGVPLPWLRMPVAEFPLRLARALDGAAAVVLPSKAPAALAALHRPGQVIPLQIHTVSHALESRLPADRNHLVAVASRWRPFLEIARTMLVSTGFAPESLLLRDAQQPGWQSGLDVAAVVVCDSATAETLPTACRAVPFPIVTESCLTQLKEGAVSRYTTVWHF